MARRKSKKVVAQHIVGTAAAGMPKPLRDVASTRWGARLVILAVAALFITGVATLDWSQGMPKLKIDRERAQEVRKEVRHDVEIIADRLMDGHH